MQSQPVATTEIEPPAATRHAAGSILFSLAFWLILLTAAAVLAAVQLAPGLVRWHHATLLQQQHATELHQLELELQRLERLTATLAADPEFLAAVRDGGHATAAARNQLRLESPLPVAEPQSPFQTQQTFATDGALTTGFRIPGFSELLHHTLLPVAYQLSGNPQLRHRLMWLAALLTLFAFTCLNDSGFQTAWFVATTPLSLLRQLWCRYRRMHQIPINQPEPVADPPVPIIIPEDNRSDSSVGRATDS